MGYHESKMINFQTPQSWIFEKKIVDDAPPAGQPKGRAGKSGKFVDQNGQRLHISAGATAMAHFSYYLLFILIDKIFILILIHVALFTS